MDEHAVSRIAAAIGEPSRTRMLYCLMDQRARTSTELAVIGEVSPSTASVHLNRLKAERLIKMQVQGKHRYYTLAGGEVASVLEGLLGVAGNSRNRFVPSTPNRLRAARTCYDHIAGTLGVLLHDRLQALGWLAASDGGAENSYQATPKGCAGLESLGIDLEGARKARRRFAFACLDWSERRSHIGGALGVALLEMSLKRKWVVQDPDSRVLSVSSLGRREMLARFGFSA